MSAVDQNLVANLEESFLLFIESVPDAMVLSNREGQIVLVNVNTESCSAITVMSYWEKRLKS